MTMLNSWAATLQFDLADRMRKAMRVRDLGVQELADALGVSRNTISNWIGGRATPSTPALMAFASVTEVPLEWLKTGAAPSEDGADASRPWESNPRPSHYKRNGSPLLDPYSVYALAYCLVRKSLAESW
jgi:transcriptional regulator with XRE-family HTH domain